MKTVELETHVKPWVLEILFIVLIIGLNPISYFLFYSTIIFPPDAIAYGTLAKDFITKGLLYLPSWGHIDSGLILPPLYPFLIACGRIFSQETFTVAELISSISMLIFTILVYFYIKKVANRLIAVIAIIVIQINYHFFLIGMSQLSESVFLLMIGLTLWLTLLFLNKPSKKQNVLSLFIGVSCSLVFFSRQVGMLIYGFISILFLLQYFRISGNGRRILFGNYLSVICGALLLFIPYTISLYKQTGQYPLTQGFRKNEYVIKVTNPEILAEINREKSLPAELLKIIEAQSDKDYGIAYAERRRMRKLLPDASEMYDYVCITNHSKTDQQVEVVLNNLKKPGVYFDRLYKNIFHLKSAMGVFTTILFFLLCFFPLIVKTDKNRDLSRFLLPSFIIFYLLVISLFTCKISRYIYILFPFCIMHISIESYQYIKRIKDFYKARFPESLIFIFLFVVILLTTPSFFMDLELHPLYRGLENEYGHDFKKIVNGEPVFSMRPYEAYIIGSPYRTLPNDSLEKVAIYGKGTGVRWILIFRAKGTISELLMYSNAGWYSIPSLGKAYPDLVKFRLGTTDGVMALYEIL